MHHWIATALIVTALAFANRARAQDEAVTLTVKPVLCITDSRHRTCDMSFLIRWRSQYVGFYCLYNDFADVPIACWRQEASGETAEDRVIERSFSYWLTDGDAAVRLAEALVEVMTTDSDDRRRNRRRRHAWNIL